MFVVSLLIWPSPAVALMGAFFIPLAQKAGLPAIYMAVALNLFGHGAALSGDFFIQGVPAVAAESAGYTSSDLMPYLVPLWITMTVITIGMSFLLMKLDVRHMKKEDTVSGKNSHECRMISSDETGKKRRIFFLVMGLLLMFDIVVVVTCDVSGDDALTLITGTVLVISGILCLLFFGMSQAASKFIGFMTGVSARQWRCLLQPLSSSRFSPSEIRRPHSRSWERMSAGFLSDLVHALVSGLHVPGFACRWYSLWRGSLQYGWIRIRRVDSDWRNRTELPCFRRMCQDPDFAGADRDYLGRRRDCDPLGCDPGLCNMRSVTARTCKEKSHPGSLRACRHDRVCCDSHGSCIRLQHQETDSHDSHAQHQAIDGKFVISVFSGGRKQLVEGHENHDPGDPGV